MKTIISLLTNKVMELKTFLLHVCLTFCFVLLFVSQAGAEISTVNPEQYSKRFYEFMSNILS